MQQGLVKIKGQFYFVPEKDEHLFKAIKLLFLSGYKFNENHIYNYTYDEMMIIIKRRIRKSKKDKFKIHIFVHYNRNGAMFSIYDLKTVYIRDVVKKYTLLNEIFSRKEKLKKIC